MHSITRHTIFFSVITIEDDDQIQLNRNNTPNHFQPTQDTVGHRPNPFNQSQYLSQVPSSHVGQIDQSQSSVGSRVIQSDQSQSQPVKNSNVTCGNCGEKGHNRTFIHCPRYHTAEETAHREVGSLMILYLFDVDSRQQLKVLVC